jgi:uncharacterized protein HemX
MTDSAPEAKPAGLRPSARATLALVAAVAALGLSTLQWFSDRGEEGAGSDEIGKLQRRLQALDDRLERSRAELARVRNSIGDDGLAEESLAARLTRLEDSLARLPGGGEARFLWAAEQAEEYLRAANARENLARDTAGALVALTLADAQLQASGDPRFTPVRKLIAAEQAALRAVPKVDTEGLALRLDTLAQSLGTLPRKDAAPPSFRAEPVPADAELSGYARARAAVSNAFTRIVSIRRTPEPTVTLLPDEAAAVLLRSLQLELQVARLALVQGETAGFRTALAATRRGLTQYFDAGHTGVQGTLAELDAIAATPLPERLPDISGSLGAMVRLRESGWRR